MDWLGEVVKVGDGAAKHVHADAFTVRVVLCHPMHYKRTLIFINSDK